MKKVTFVTLGFLFVGLGTLGIFLPVLPTTPFLLLAAFFFARSSKRYYTWLIKTPLLGEYIRNYQEGGGVTRKNKIVSITFLWLMLGVAALWFLTVCWGRVLLLLVGIGVTLHLLSLKTRSAAHMTNPVTNVEEPDVIR